ncbi:DapH/DapD/GlmU-related protein [Campylobacter hyointestinalis]|nr:DapH/DapD/GlmU-related protein [Campylobacter hyointestinalis]
MGANSIILPGVMVGENAVIRAGSIVTKSIPPKVVAVGNHCKIIKKLD